MLGYNIIGQISGSRERLVAALYHTMKDIFPQVYMFPAEESENIVFIATKDKEMTTWNEVQEEGDACVHSGLVNLPTFTTRAKNFVNRPQLAVTNVFILTDDNVTIEQSMLRE